MGFCEGCFLKQRRIDQLEEEIKSLKAKLKYRAEKEKEGYFGLSTPSSKQPVKTNTKEENQSKRGGAKPGHRGYGRKSVNETTADRIEVIAIADQCPQCGSHLENKGIRERTVIDSVPLRAEKILYQCEKYWCPRCNKTVQAKPPVLANGLYGNQLVAQAAVMHYGHGIPMGRVEAILGEHVLSGSLLNVFHRLGKLWEPAREKLIAEYRRAAVKHADETGWRTDGHSGYAWLFCTPQISIFAFRDNRSAKVAEEILGRRKLAGVLGVDRYGAYNKAPCKIQYCYAHLLRDVKDLGKQFIDEPEVQSFVSTFSPLLSQAMHLRSEPISDAQYYKRAAAIKRQIIKVTKAAAHHLGIRALQDIFRQQRARLYHWVKDRNVPPDNNQAERDLRPTVIARKVSFGSQSDAGAKTRSILMTVLQTAQKRLKNQTLEDWFKAALDLMVQNPTLDPHSLLPPAPT